MLSPSSFAGELRRRSRSEDTWRLVSSHPMTRPSALALPRLFTALALLTFSSTLLRAQAPSTPAAHNVILVMTDGLRWQELVRGADASLLTPKHFYDGRNVDQLRQQFLASTPEERRRRLMPFVWSTLVPEGQLFGDRDAGSDAAVTNGFNFSYPGYSETLTGHGDPRVSSNDAVPNPNVTVLEWLDRQPGFEHSVAAFGAWDVISSIVNAGRCQCVVNAGYHPLLLTPGSGRLDLLNQMKADAPRIWDDEAFDSPTFETAMEYVREKHPRVLFLSLGETDDWAHSGNYGEYLLSAHRVDQYLERLWKALQAMPEYRGNTSLVFTTDHGRGTAGEDWTSHGQKLPESKYIFVGALGAGIPGAGLRANVPAITQSEIAATLARLLGQDWNRAEPQAAQPLVFAPVSAAKPAP